MTDIEHELIATLWDLKAAKDRIKLLEKDSQRLNYIGDELVPASFARQLERELNAANERIKRLENVEKSHAEVLKAIDEWMKRFKSKEVKL